MSQFMRCPTSRAQPVVDASDATRRRWRFGDFVLWENQRRLERHGHPIRLGSRGFGLLLALLKRAGEVVGKGELLAAAWPDVVVDEASVRVHMSLLRKALGEPREEDGCLQWIANIPLQGYRFLGQVDCELAPAAIEARGAASDENSQCSSLPARLSKLVAREGDVARLLGLLNADRLVTVTGGGGVGKTSVAIRAAEHYGKRQGGRVRFVDLAPLTSQGQVAATTARAIGIPGDLGDVEQAVIRRLEGESVLLLVDNCEHVLAALAPFAYRLLAALPDLRILATSREALGIAGERVLRLMPLAVPEVPPSSLVDALRSPSVQLLMERAMAVGAEAFDDASGGPLARICQWVDGIPLAIELIAERLAFQSVSELALRHDDHMRLHSARNRTVVPRQRTMAATLDWSVCLLSGAELMLFRRLAVFRSHFALEAAVSLMADELEPHVASDALLSLTGKSLVVFDPDNNALAPYRLLETTRSYALSLLGRADEQAVVAGTHARHVIDLMRRATAEDEVLAIDDVCDTRRPGSEALS